MTGRYPSIFIKPSQYNLGDPIGKCFAKFAMKFSKRDKSASPPKNTKLSEMTMRENAFKKRQKNQRDFKG